VGTAYINTHTQAHTQAHTHTHKQYRNTHIHMTHRTQRTQRHTVAHGWRMRCAEASEGCHSTNTCFGGGGVFFVFDFWGWYWLMERCWCHHPTNQPAHPPTPQKPPTKPQPTPPHPATPHQPLNQTTPPPPIQQTTKPPNHHPHHPKSTKINHLRQLPSDLGERRRELLPQNGQPRVDPCVDGDGVLPRVPLLDGLHLFGLGWGFGWGGGGG
jgi:hypothetical protein